MKNLTTAYLVLSIRDIETLLRAAEASAKAAGDKKSHCIIMRDIRLYHDQGCDEIQISSHDVTTRAEAVQATAEQRMSREDLEVFRGIWESIFPSREYIGVHEALGMNHSDAAI